MAWQTVSRKGAARAGKGSRTSQSMTAILAQSMNTRPPPGSEGQGKGKPPKGQARDRLLPPGKEKTPNLKPTEERAEPTTEEAKCPKCPNTCNWTTRVVCRSCGCKLPRGMSPKAPPSQQSAGPASMKTGGGGSSSGASSQASYASVVKGETGPAETIKEEKGSKRKQIPWRNCQALWQQTTPQRGSRKPTRTAPSCPERPSQPGGETRRSHGQNAQKRTSRNAKSNSRLQS